MVKCANCKKDIEGKKFFDKGKFFCSRDCQKAWKEKAKKAKPKDNVCEFC